MPSIRQGSLETKRSTTFTEDFEYEYPDGLDLHPNSKLHKKLKDLILERAREASTHISTRFESWREIDQFLTAYKRIDKEEAEVLDDDPRKPVSIVFPYSYAILETLLSYMMAAFFQDPIFRYEGYSPDDVVGAILLEKVVNLHCNKFKVMLNLHTMFRDSFAYGIGVVAPVWKVTSKGDFAGNALENIDPYLYLPDPNVAADKIQDGEFVGWISPTNYMDLLSEENNNEDMFNVKYLKALGNKRTAVSVGDQSDRALRTGDTKSENTILNPTDEIPMYMKIVPKDLGLGDSEVPEKWFFRLAADTVIITARPADFEHDKFPVAVCAPDYDGYSSAPLSRMEVLGGLQGILDWLFNSHIANVRKAINDMLIYDPYLVNSKDLEDPKPGKLIRMRRPAWGKGVKDAVQQLQVNDVTRANVADSSFIVQWMQKIGATDDAAMGSLRTGGPERLTKAEFQGTASGAVSRLERIAKVIGLQAMQDIGEFFAEHTQQMMDEDAYIKVAGDWLDVLQDEYGTEISRGRMKVSPDDLDINYDILVRDGSIPGSNFSDVWVRMFETLAGQPDLAKNFDIVRIFKHIARNSGAKNVNDFVRQGGNLQPSIAPDADISAGLANGSLAPVGGAL
jgi:hypothetical protein